MAAKQHVGSDLEALLVAKGILADTQATAIKRVLVFQLQAAMKKGKVSKTALAKRMHLSRSVIDRLLDPDDTMTSLQTLSQAATALNMRLLVAMDTID